MREDDLLNKIYADGIISTCNPRMARYLHALSFKKPHMRILEVGAGTGGVTSFLLHALERDGATMVDRFHYTDISTGFFEQAKLKFSKWRSCIEFKALDITKDPESQGFEAYTYDLVIASNVLHATPVISQTLQNIHKLLKSDGRMLLLELTGKTAAIQAIFGILPGQVTQYESTKSEANNMLDGGHSTMVVMALHYSQRMSGRMRSFWHPLVELSTARMRVEIFQFLP
jgi:ubiquinone/menaquinone biosynthesis C-methylase UbiE